MGLTEILSSSLTPFFPPRRDREKSKVWSWRVNELGFALLTGGSNLNCCSVSVISSVMFAKVLTFSIGQHYFTGNKDSI